VLEHLDSFGFNLEYTKKCIEQNKHNHFTTSYYLMLKKYTENGGHLDLEISESNFEKVGNKTAYAGAFKSAITPNSVQNKGPHKPKIDPFAHLTPVARRFIENSEFGSNKVYATNNTNKRMNSTGVGQKRHKSGAESPKPNFEGSDKSYSPRRAELKPSGNPNSRFTSTVMGPFRGKGGYSAPQQKRDINGYVEVSKGPFFSSNNRTNTATTNIDKRSTSSSIKNKAQLPNVSKQRVQIKSQNERHYQPPVYPNSVVAGNISRSNNSSKRRDIPSTNNSFQVANNNFIQTSYGNMGGFGGTQLLNNSMGSTNTTRTNPKKYKINNFHTGPGTGISGAQSNMNTIYLRKYNKNLFNIYKTKHQGRQTEVRNRSPNSPRNKSNNPRVTIPTHQIFGKQFGNVVPKGPGSQNCKQNVTSNRANYSPRAGTDINEYPGIMNNTMTGGFINNSFNISGTNKMNVITTNKRNLLKNSRY
jgi:hypothetical protein